MRTYALGLVFFLLFSLFLFSAPTPKKKDKIPSLTGTWIYHWCDSKGAVEFYKDGSYKSTFGSNAWEGSYGFDGKNLHIFERQIGDGWGSKEWGLTKITLDKDLKGKATSDVGRDILGEGYEVRFTKK